MILGSNPFVSTPKFRLGKSELDISDSIDILGVSFDSKLTYSTNTEKRISCCWRSYYGLSDIGMCYPGLPTDVKCHLWRSICVPSFVHGFDAISINISLQLIIARLSYQTGSGII